eukprot:Clim_evm3s17 gene=Clim_evmTU3s17
MSVATLAGRVGSNLLRFRDVFTAAVEKRPFAHRVLLTMTMYGISDVSCQYIFVDKPGIDWSRTAKMVAVGGVVGAQVTPWLWFLNSPTGPGTPFRKLIVDMSLFAPWITSCVFTTHTFLDSNIAWEDKVSHSAKRIENDLVPTWIRACSYWPVVNFLNFKYVTPPNQLFGILGASFVWNAYISFVTNKGLQEDDPTESEEEVMEKRVSQPIILSVRED